ncbi:hypothetical protein PSP6_280100 [Paraburkholderia tropica]|nr:hypothetical protein PSP6_280100 [Paraburkholderia tropica]
MLNKVGDHKLTLDSSGLARAQWNAIAMTRRRVPGANEQLARHTLPFMLAAPDVEITLYLRRAARLDPLDRSRVRTVTQKGEPFVGHTTLRSTACRISSSNSSPRPPCTSIAASA